MAAMSLVTQYAGCPARMLTGDTHVLTLRQETSTIGTFGVVASLVRPDLPVLSIISTYYSISIHQDFISSLLDYCSQLSSTRLPYTVTAADLFQCFPFGWAFTFSGLNAKETPSDIYNKSLSVVSISTVPLVKGLVAWQDLLL